MELPPSNPIQSMIELPGEERRTSRGGRNKNNSDHITMNQASQSTQCDLQPDILLFVEIPTIVHHTTFHKHGLPILS